MTMQQIEDKFGTTTEVASLSGDVELNLTHDVSVSIVLTPRQARALARQLLAQADAEEYGDES